MKVYRQLETVSSCYNCPHIDISISRMGTYTNIVVACKQLLLRDSDNSRLMTVRIPMRLNNEFEDIVREAFGDIPDDCPLERVYGPTS